MIKTKKQMFIVIGAFLLTILLGTVTYAFFNYTRTGTANTIKTGRIAFNSDQGTAINLTNMFPIDVTNGIPDDNTKVGTVTIHVTGDTTYNEGVEYLVSAVNVTNTVGSKKLPISIDVVVTSNTNNDPATTLGTQDDDYFTNRDSAITSIYKVLARDTINANDQLVVGYIKSGVTGVDGNIVIRAYLDKARIAISDTYDGNETDNMGTTNEWVGDRTIFTTTEWNSLQQNGVSFKVKVEANEGIWVDEAIKSLYSIMRRNAVMDNINSTYVDNETPGINFKQVASESNGIGIYMHAGTENDTYPVVYYRGAVDDNNVMFAGKCWKAVRSTETGGVKLIYSEEKSTLVTYENNIPLDDTDINYTNDSNYPCSYDSETKKWSTSIHDYYTAGAFTFHVKEAGNYSISYELQPSSGTSISIYKNGVSLHVAGAGATGLFYIENINTSDEIRISFSRILNGDDNIVLQINKSTGNREAKQICEGNNSSGIELSSFNNESRSLSSNGYMYGSVYSGIAGYPVSGAYFSTDFSFDGTNYKLVNPTTLAANPALSGHYTCNSTDLDGECGTIRYYYEVYGTSGPNRYVELTNGDGIEEAIEKMHKNENNSVIKNKVDTWYQANLLSYTNKLEDTIWCNDRSIYQLGTFNPNGGNYELLYYMAYKRVSDGTPSLACSNKRDSFTVNNSNGNEALDYPVGLLTVDERMLMGGNSYINNGWTLSPAGLYAEMSDGRLVKQYVFSKSNSNGVLVADVKSYNGHFAISPSVSLKPGTLVISGTGSLVDPYIIEDN